MAAGTDAPNNAMDDVKVVNNEQFKDQYNAGELVSQIPGSHPETPTRRSHLPLPPLGALLGAAAKGEEGRPDGRRHWRQCLVGVLIPTQVKRCNR